ncbi:febd0a39-ca67-42db-b811-ab1929376945 [Thermothielavioides terrestris]|uniref:Febd0a39-ca67-42db-b811-ab1929376945 n=1 Tax=Thermothielavioides terrestris TaxID=2587410 RepID=A0A3S4BRY4_9PEZI|nr:febd0a39-ca67-42db-b811-ab1929376945 [Thermothielavioides terrestris]
MASSVFYLAHLPSPPIPLPRVPGPKLAPFTPSAQADIEFLEFLGHENDVDSLVWKVKINGGLFALKVFFFRRWEFLRDNQGADLTTPLANPQLYVDYFDPFNCECRAYGRLKEAKREDLAVKAHGYLLLTPQQEIELERRVTAIDPDPLPDANASELTGHNFWTRHEQHRGLPVRAIVKDFVPGDRLTSAQVRAMWPDLQELHSLGILVGDTHGGNYLGGKLVDFSRSLTMYHPGLHYILRARKGK